MAGEIFPIGSVKEATTPEEVAEVGRFRYQVYFEEMKFDFPEMDHAARSFTDKLDDQAVNLFVRNEPGEIVGVIRGVLLERMEDWSAIKKYWKLYNIPGFAEIISPPGRMIINRFLIHPDYRVRSKVAWKLITAIYHQTEKLLAPIVFIDCSPHLVKFYEALGFRRYHENFVHPVLGYKVPLVILLQDVEYLRKIKSPLYIFGRKRRDATNLAGWFSENFPDYGDSMLAQGFDQDLIMTGISRVKPALPRSFTQMSQKIKNSCMIRARQGDRIINQGEMGTEMYLILKGSVQIQMDREAGQPPKKLGILGPGEVFGELGFVVEHPRTASVVAEQDSELLMIAANNAEHLAETHPREAAHLFLELTRLMAARFVDLHQGL